MSGPPTVPMGDIPTVPPGFSAAASGRSAQVIQIDNGKAVHVVAICAAICGICMAVTIGTVWHSKDREVATEAQLRKTQNHADEAYDKAVILEKLYEQTQKR